MQIQLKQAEIMTAIKQYVANQGINLNGKTVDISFSATRGAAGIIADVSIEEVNIPGFTDSTVDDAAKPALTVVSTATATEAPQAEVPEAKQAAEDAGQDPAPAKATSLFN